MDHPPIPPKCKRFELYCEGPEYQFVLNRRKYDYIWIGQDRAFRDIIAAVARCAWLDEYDRLVIQPTDAGVMAAMRDAKKNANDWKKWARRRLKYPQNF